MMETHECKTAAVGHPQGVEIIEQRMLVPNVNILTVHAPAVARKIQPGQFVILRTDDHAERMPLTVADWDRQAGTVTCIFMQVGTSTQKLGQLKAGERLATFVGPLGHPLEMDYFGTVVLTSGCYGIGALYPAARRLKELGNHVIGMVEARGSFLLYWIEKYRAVCDELIISTFDGSKVGKALPTQKGEGPEHLKDLLASGRTIDRVIGLGCTFMMFETAQATRPSGVKTIVSLNPIMIDGTGMCGACRVVVGGETKFACVDGPDFDAHQIDWELLLARRKPYIEAEAASLESC
ncbi:MAG: sulfide/dihydroorotate dehydrogenase-like FAD/NAD-binding protein [Chloroflexota bacterium]